MAGFLLGRDQHVRWGAGLWLLVFEALEFFSNLIDFDNVLIWKLHSIYDYLGVDLAAKDQVFHVVQVAVCGLEFVKFLEFLLEFSDFSFKGIDALVY